MAYKNKSNANISKLCDTHCYPPHIRHHLINIVAILEENLSFPFSAILYGSFARGEPTIVRYRDQVEIFSDFDIFIYTGKEICSGELVNDEFQKYRVRLNFRNTLFHLGVKLRGDKELGQESLLFHLYDIRENGVTLLDTLGKNPLLRIKVSDMERLLPFSLETRLWYTLLYLPRNQKTIVERHQTNYLLMRAILEIVSVICILNGYLPKSYLKRYRYVRESKKSNILKNIIIEEDEIITASLKGKLNGSLDFDTKLLISKVEAIYRNTADFLYDRMVPKERKNSIPKEDFDLLLRALSHLVLHPDIPPSSYSEYDEKLREYSKRRLDKYQFEKKDQSELYSKSMGG